MTEREKAIWTDYRNRHALVKGALCLPADLSEVSYFILHRDYRHADLGGLSHYDLRRLYRHVNGLYLVPGSPEDEAATQWLRELWAEGRRRGFDLRGC